MGRVGSFLRVRSMTWIYIPQLRETSPVLSAVILRVLPRPQIGLFSFRRRAKLKSFSSPQRGASQANTLGFVSTLNFPFHCGSRQLSQLFGALSGGTSLVLYASTPVFVPNHATTPESSIISTGI